MKIGKHMFVGVANGNGYEIVPFSGECDLFRVVTADEIRDQETDSFSFLHFTEEAKRAADIGTWASGLKD